MMAWVLLLGEAGDECKGDSMGCAAAEWTWTAKNGLCARKSFALQVPLASFFVKQRA